MPQPQPAIEDEAAIWVARMDAGVWTDADEAELQAWLAHDPRRKGALVAAEAAWLAATPGALEQAAEEVRATDDADTGAPRFRVRRRSILAGAGVAIAASFAGGLFLFGGPTTYSTDLGEIRRVPLQDGSLAAINTASEVTVKLASTRRRVTLERGEVWFQVAKDATRPFVVEAGRVRVEAVGTAFSVRRREEGAEILVTEGVVEAWTDGAEGNRIRLSAGQRAFVAENAAVRHEEAAPSAVDRDLAWRGGKIDLLATPLSDAIAEFNRYNRRQLVLVDTTLAGEPLSGVFGTDDPNGFALTVRDVLAVPVDTSRPDEIRIGKPRR